jgi:pyridoxal phosphate enzyme (YggS family)
MTPPASDGSTSNAETQSTEDQNALARRTELAGALERLRHRIEQACAAAGRDPGEITLIGITKTYPVADARTLLELGVGDLGENRANEARDKAAELPTARWHFVGQLQTNKARVVARFASAVHSVDRPVLVAALDRAVAQAERAPLDVFLQISLDGDERRGGVVANSVAALADEVTRAGRLRLAGVMAVAPQEQEPDDAFARLEAISADLRTRHEQATAISAGMSNDLEAAIFHGATHVRVGSALLGQRPPVVS